MQYRNKLLPDSAIFYYYLLCNRRLILSLVPIPFCHTRGGPGYSAVSRVGRATHESCGLAGGPASRESEFLAGGRNSSTGKDISRWWDHPTGPKSV